MYRGRFLLATLILYAPLAQTTPSDSFEKKISRYETSVGGRIGIAAINSADNAIYTYRANERFPLCSTFKAMAVAALLKESASRTNLLSKRVRYQRKHLETSGYSPITKLHIKEGMTLQQLAEVAIRYSDSTAANLIIKELGGPDVITKFAHLVGDTNFQLNRTEPNLNSAIPGDPRDTTTPLSTVNGLKNITTRSILGVSNLKLYIEWLKNNTTGGRRIRAGVPKGWVVGDKTGSCSYGTTNDIGVIWPPNKQPIFISVYYTQKDKKAKWRSDVIAEVTRELLSFFNNS